MGIGFGLGIVLVAGGLVLVPNVVNFDIGLLDDDAQGGLLSIVGMIALILTLVKNHQRSSAHHVEQEWYDNSPVPGA